MVTDIIEISKKQCEIVINDEFAFVLYKGELKLYGIQKGKILEDEVYNKIIGQVLMKRARLRAMNLLKSRAYTEKKLREKLQRSRYPQACIDGAIAYVKSYGYINDEQYAADYIFYHGGGLNRQQIFRKLRQRGIAEEIVCNAYREYYNEGNAPEEEKLIYRFLKKKNFEPEGNDAWEKRNKMTRTLLQKGFSYDKIIRVFDSYGKNDEEWEKL